MSTKTLTVEEIVGLFQALPQLDGYNKVNKDGSVSLVPYDFDDSTRWNIVKNKRILKLETETYEERRQELIKELSPLNLDVAKEDAIVLDVFRKRNAAILKVKTEVTGLLSFKKGDLLKENKNPIAGSILELLYPLIEDAEEVKK